MLILPTVPTAVYAGEGTDIVQNSINTVESSEKPENGEETETPDQTEKTDGEQDSESESGQSEDENPAENDTAADDVEKKEDQEEEFADPIENSDAEIETDQRLFLMENSGGNIANGVYRNEEDGSDITWSIDLNEKLIVVGTGNFRSTEDVPPPSDGITSNQGRYPWLIYSDHIKSAEIKVTGTTDASDIFSGCKNMISVNLSSFDTGSVTNMSGMFAGCSSLVNVDVSGFDTSKVTNMFGMFSGCSSLSEIDLSNFDTGKVTDMSFMFSGCSSLSEIDLRSFDTSNVTNMIYMFSKCSSLKALDLSMFNTSRVTNLQGVFSECENLEKINLSNFNTRNVICMAYMFKKCNNLVNVDLSMFQTEKLELIEDMFSGCKSLVSLDLSGFDLSGLDIDDGTNVFKDCEILTEICTPYNIRSSILLPASEGYMWYEPDGTIITELPQNRLKSIRLTKKEIGPDEEIASGEYIENGSNIIWRINGSGKLVVEGKGEFAELAKDSKYMWTRAPWYSKRLYIKSAEINVTNMTDASFMFYDCDKMSSINVCNFDTSQVTDMQEMFKGCRSLKVIDLYGFDTSNVTNMSSMFSMRDSAGEMDNEKSYAGPVSLNISSFNTKKVTDMSDMFFGCGNLTDLDISNFDTDNVENMSGMFGFCRNLTRLDTSSFHTNKVTDMNGMFDVCTNLKSLDLSSFDTGNVTDMSDMFSGCNELTSLNVNSFNTSNVTDMSSMFNFCNNLMNLDLSNFDTGCVTNMSGMFMDCRKLTNLDISSFNTSQVTNMSHMFFDCGQESFNLDVSNFDTSKVNDMSSMFQSCHTSNLNVSNFNTSNVTHMSWMFASNSLISVDVKGLNTSNVRDMAYLFCSCYKLKELDLSSFDVAKVTRLTGMFDICLGLNKIETPRNLKQTIELPKAEAGDSWQDATGNTYTELPVNLDYSIVLQRKGNFENDDIDKQTLSVSGINIEDKEYDGTPNSYTGNAVLTDTAGELVSDVSLVYFYSGTLTDGSVYTETEEAPSQAGSYTLSFKITESTANRYNLNNSSYSFEIIPKVVTITAKSVEIKAGEQLPEISDLKYTVDGLVENEELLQKPSLKYSIDNISTAKEGKYEIIPYNADAGNNYNLEYVNGILLVVTSKAYIALHKVKTSYIAGEQLNTDDLEVTYYNETGTPSKVSVYTTNANEIDMSTPGIKTLVVTYQNLTAEIEITVSKRQPEVERGLKISFKNEQDQEVVYTGNAMKPELKVSYNGRQLTEGTNYTVKYSNNVKVGNAKITVTGKGNFKSSKTEYFKIVQADIVNAEFAGTDQEGQLVVVQGSKFAPAIYCGSRKLSTNDYSLSGMIQAGKKITDGDSGKVITIKGKGNYTGSKEITLKVVRKNNLTKFTVTIDKTKLNTLTYDGRAHYIHEIQGALKVTGKDGNTNMQRGIDYMVVYPTNVTDAGTKKISVVGMGLYTGTVSKSYTIKPAVNTSGFVNVEYESGNIEKIKLPYRSTGVTFNNQLRVTYTKDGNTLLLREGKDYKVTYSGNKKVGNKAKFTISFLGNYKSLKKQIRMFTIEKADLENAVVVIADAAYKKKPGIYKSVPYLIEPETGRFINASNYKVSYYIDETRNIEMKGKNKVSSGDIVYVKIEAKANGNYRSDSPIVKTYQVANAINLSNMKISFIDAKTECATQTAEYTGNKITDQEIKVLINGKCADEDVVITYANNIAKGKATVIITGTGKPGCKYTGCKKATFNIVAYSLR